VRVRGAAEMHREVMTRAEGADVVIMAAAVADYAPASPAAQKVSKVDDRLTLVLTRTPDILGELGARRAATGRGPVLVGFAAETEEVVARGRAKREHKQVDLIVANDVSRADAGFDVDTNAVTIIGPRDAEALPLQSKAGIAAEILNRVAALLAARPLLR
jgi:phosphopantothenoylcysteine decarboxylase / phosphopantothenate---cysteine ligase